ncbi:hypothetical protein TELCIR_02764 [Teladorsagia circumcincta]|uniref:Uncharacterized protein n=1 Tax=Teladorsagia circumcincta TaxID=45464 RepID=A0A2G9UY77_TELCI|nr:hypothetical protein TELCIR_02764 [Teladorsagia circumcincta]
MLPQGTATRNDLTFSTAVVSITSSTSIQDSSINSMKKQPPSPIEKYSRPPHFLGFPPRQSSNQGYFPALSSAPMLEDYMDHGTMRIGEKVDPQADHSSRRSPTDV